MRKINLDPKSFLASGDEKKFIILGSKKASLASFVKDQILPKIKREIKESVPGFWGTLGFSDDNAIDWTGHLEISSEGNDEFRGVVEEEVELIKTCFPRLRDEPKNIREKFISFEHINFNFPDIFTLDQIPKLRLDVMLDPEEGAVVFYQSDRENLEENSIEYIQPQATKGNSVHDRDRLKYLFEIIPQYQLEELKSMPGFYRLNTYKEPKPFIIKILTFKRSFEEEAKNLKTGSKDIITKVEDELNRQIHKKKIHKAHKLLIFNRVENTFQEARINDIHPELKTLFLMHGTFSDTAGSYGDLYGKNARWLKKITAKNLEMHYEQVIAFDHPTLFFGAEENTEELFNCMDELNIQKFSGEVDFMGSSQGGVIVQYLSNLKSERIKVGKVALIASANGVGYLTAGEYVAKFLSVMKYFFKATGLKSQAMVASLAQHSAEFLLDQPGLQIMTPGNEKLESIMNSTPSNPDTRYLPVIDDYDESILDEENRRFIRFIKRMGARAIDKVASKILGEYNDWVVGTKNQFIVPWEYSAIPNYNPSKFREHIIPAIHGKALKNKEALKEIERFFLGSQPMIKQEALSSDHFDSHCHIFGREIITGRILLLLIDEILSYKKAKNSNTKLALIPDLTAEMDIENGDEKNSGSVAKNIIKYFALNKNSYQVLDDLDKEYYKLKANVYRYIPLMFDLEMTFRNKYKGGNSLVGLDSTENQFKKQITDYLNELEGLIEKFEKGNKLIFDGNLVENEASVKVLKFIKKSLKVLNVINPDLEGNTKTGYQKQVDELKALKHRYGNNIFPFLATDPRRKDMARIILENVGPGKAFHGIKLYAPNGYSPTDPHLFEDSTAFIDGKSLYSWCIENNIPIMAHCSNAGFSTFVMDLEVMGDVRINEKLVHYNEPTKITFNNNVLKGGFARAVRERGATLNHPQIWEKVLQNYPKIKICLAHFGGESEIWRKEIARLMGVYSNLYTDLSCITHQDRLEKIRKAYFGKKNKIKDRIMYGSDFYLNMLDKLTFSDYYEHFRRSFHRKELKEMSVDVPKRFLGV